MAEHNKNETLLLSKYKDALPVPKIALGARTSAGSSNKNSTSGGGVQSSSSPSGTSSISNAELNEVVEDKGESIVHRPTDDTVEQYSVPSLDKVLSGEAGAPLSQYNFYCFLRKEYQAEENLNFWLDVANHEHLWKTWNENEKRKDRRSNITEKGGIEEEIYVEEEFELSHNYKDSQSSGVGTLTASEDSQNPVVSSGYVEEGTNGKTRYRRRINEEDLHKSAKNIYRKYAHLNIFPEENRATMQDLILRQGRYNPVVFSSSKSYVYHIMNVIYYPKFIESAVDMNLTQLHAIIALPLGMIALTCGIALELYYIFMAWNNRWFRLYGLIPIWLGWVLLQTAMTRFLPPLILFGLSEHKLFRFHKIKENSILRVHRKRALQFVAYDTAVSLLSLGILLAIPPIKLGNFE